MLIACGRTGTVLRVNRALAALADRRAGDLAGKPLWELRPFEGTDVGEVVFKELQKQKRIFYDDLPFVRMDGSRITVDMTCSMHRSGGSSFIHCLIRNTDRYARMKEELRAAEARFLTLFRHAGIGIGLLDSSGRFLEANARLCSLLGYGSRELTGQSCVQLLGGSENSAQAGLFHEIAAGSRESYSLAQRCVRRDGSEFWAQITVSAVRRAGNGPPPYLIFTLEDISARKRAEDELANSRDFHRSILYGLPNPVRIMDTDGMCDYVNQAWLEFTGRKLKQEIGEGWTERVHPEDLARIREIVAVALRNRTPFSTEYRLADRNGRYRWVEESGRPFHDIDGAYAGFISSCYDVHDRKMFEDRLHAISLTDDLTGLLNRRGFFSFAIQQIKQANRSRSGFLFLYADLDGLKTINDTLGHQEGDLALAETAGILREVFRESDLIARLGGDEFAVLMTEQTAGEGSMAVLARLRECIARHNARPNRSFTLSISTGIKYYDPARPCTLDELISRADRLMYEEKKSKARPAKSTGAADRTDDTGAGNEEGG